MTYLCVDDRSAKLEPTDHAVQALVRMTKTSPVKLQPSFNSADGQSSEPAFPKQLISCVERSNLHDVVKSHRPASTDKSSIPAADQHLDDPRGEAGFHGFNPSPARPKIARVGVYWHEIVDSFPVRWRRSWNGRVIRDTMLDIIIASITPMVDRTCNALKLRSPSGMLNEF
jgi:hypothetical protein